MNTSNDTGGPAAVSQDRGVNLAFGWSAPSFSEQLPALTADQAKTFDRDNMEIIRLSVRGVISETERNRAIARVTKMIGRTLLASKGDRS